MIRFESQNYFINDVREWEARGELALSPKFQRRYVWSDAARSFLMDTILRGYPISKIFMRHDFNPSTRRTIREVIDGQQRLTTILLFLKDGFKISTNHSEDYGGFYFSQLPDHIKQQVLQYKIAVDVLLGANDMDVLDIFARLNTYTVQLNKQELLNAKYVGHFKQAVYQLGHEYVDYWRRNNLLTERSINRMGEAEFASELLILLIDGIQDRKSIPEYYSRFDREFPQKQAMIQAFRDNMQTIQAIFEDESLGQSKFCQKSLFYSLFSVIEEFRPANAVSVSHFSAIYRALDEIDTTLRRPIEEVPTSFVKFYDAATKHVTDLSRRQIRHDFIKFAFLNIIQPDPVPGVFPVGQMDSAEIISVEDAQLN